jgi:hypothetical protein
MDIANYNQLLIGIGKRVPINNCPIIIAIISPPIIYCISPLRSKKIDKFSKPSFLGAIYLLNFELFSIANFFQRKPFITSLIVD